MTGVQGECRVMGSEHSMVHQTRLKELDTTLGPYQVDGLNLILRQISTDKVLVSFCFTAR